MEYQSLLNRALGRHLSSMRVARRYYMGWLRPESRVEYTLYKYPGFIRRFFRRVGLDKSTWPHRTIKRWTEYT